jgi:hypothetical protein
MFLPTSFYTHPSRALDRSATMPSSLIPIPTLAWALWKENELLKNKERKLNDMHEHYYIES